MKYKEKCRSDDTSLEVKSQLPEHEVRLVLGPDLIGPAQSFSNFGIIR